MLIKDYTENCLKFAKETKKWESLNQYSYYLTNGFSWNETCDGNGGGLDVSWAFNMPDNEIKKLAPQKFVDLIHEEIITAIDNDLSADQIGELVDMLVNVPPPIEAGVRSHSKARASASRVSIVFQRLSNLGR